MTEHPTEGSLRMMTTPLAWSDAPPHELRPAPRLGEHSVEILLEAGYAEAEIEKMIAQSVTRTPSKLVSAADERR
jgi:crotonobetainyl-CoA:carnitine CoA-transferase CaiB-like acyl-CoA transferase